MRFNLRNFRSSDDGAVTVDWVVLCAVIIGLSVSIVVSMTSGAVNLADNTVPETPGDL